MTTITWNGNLGHNWFTGGNWSSVVLPPGAGDDVSVSTVGRPYVEITSAGAIASTVTIQSGNQLFVANSGTLNASTSLKVGGGSGNSYVEIDTGGSITTAAAFIGYFSGGTGFVEVFGGSLNVTGAINIATLSNGGAGTLNIENGGSVSAASVIVGGSGAGAVDGVLTIGGIGGTLNTGQVNLRTAGSSFNFQASNANGFSSTIFGAGKVLVANSAGITTTLTGVNNYTGGTTISSGTLSINNGFAVGSNTVFFSGTAANLVTTTNMTLGNSIQALSGFDARLAAINGTTLNFTGSLFNSAGAGHGIHFGTVSQTGTIIFNGLNGSVSTNSLFSIDGGTLQAGNDVLDNYLGLPSSAGTAIASGATLDIASQSTFNIQNLSGSGTITHSGAGAATLTETSTTNTSFSGIINNGAGTVGLTKEGAGTLFLTGGNAYTGATIINAGTLNINGGVNFVFSTASQVTVNAGGTLQLGDTERAGSLSGSGSVDLAGNNLVVGGNSLNSTFSGIISGAGATSTLTKSGSGTLTLSGANTYAGITNVVVGALNIQNAAGLGTTALGTTVSAGAALELQSEAGIDIGAEALTLNGTGVSGGGALRNISGNNNYNGAITLGSASQINVDAGQITLFGTISGAGQNLTFGGSSGLVYAAGAIATGTGTLTKIGAGIATLAGINTYTGATTVNDGFLQLLGGAAIANTGAVVVNAPGTLQVFASETIGSLAGNGGVLLQGAPVTLTVGGANTSTAFSGVIAEFSGVGSLTKIGTGTQTLSGANSYTGTTTVSAGVLNIQNATGLGTTAGGTSVAAGAALELQGSFIIGAEALTLNGTGISGGGALRNISGGMIYNGAITLGSDSQINSDAAFLQLKGTISGSGQNLTFGGAGIVNATGAIATGTGGLTKIGSGTAVLVGANTYTGVTTVNAGDLQLVNGAAIADTSAVIVNLPGTLRVFTSETIGSLAGSGNVILQGAAVALTVGGTNTNTTFSGVISESGGIGSLTKIGTGTQTLSGANTYTGTTTVTAGALNFETFGSVFNTGDMVVNGGTLGLDNAALNVDSLSGVGGTISLSAANGATELAFGSDNSNTSYAGSITTTAVTQLVKEGSGTTTLSGIISGGVGIVNSSGTLKLSGSNTYSGPTTIEGGTVLGGAFNSFSAASAVVDDATLDLGGFNQSIKSLLGSGVVNLTGHALAINAQDSALGGISFNGAAGIDALSINFDAVTTAFSLAATAFNSWTDGTDTIILNGNALANTLTGSSHNDTINAAGGADTLIGGLGNDLLTGGLQNDIFIFNATELAVGQNDTITDYTRDVNGVGDKIALNGIAFDHVSIAMNAGNAIVSYDNGVITDTITVQNVGTTSPIYVNGYSSQANAQSGNLANGFVFVSDANNQGAHAWLNYTITYDAAGVNQYGYTYNDNGTHDVVNYDNTGVANFSSYVTSFNTSNVFDYRITFYRNGNYYTTHIDTTGQPWSNYDESYIGGLLDYRYTLNDDGTSITTHLDRLNNQTWKQYVEGNDNLGRLDYRVTTNDDNSLFVTHLDHNNNQTWTQYIDIYNTIGQHTFESFTFDTGQPVITKDITYDNAGQLWDQDIYEYNAAHVQTLHYRVMDDSSIVILP